MASSDDEDDLFGLPRKSASARARRAAAAEDSSSDDEYADVFRKPARKPRAAAASASASAELDGYVPPARAHVCDECEQTFGEALFCGECAMTYCAACDARYHGASAELRVHYRAPLHGAVPAQLARQVAE